MEKRKECPEIQKLLDEKLNLQNSVDSNVNIEENQSKICEIDNSMSSLCAVRNIEMFKKCTSNLMNTNVNYSQAGMWKLKNILILKEMDPPMAKLDKLGNLIIAPDASGCLFGAAVSMLIVLI